MGRNFGSTLVSIVDELPLAPVVTLGTQARVAQDVTAREPDRRHTQVSPGAHRHDAEGVDVIVGAAEGTGFATQHGLQNILRRLPEGDDVGMRGPVDAVGITGQLMVTVEVFMQVNTLPQQRVAILCMTYAVSTIMHHQYRLPLTYQETVVRATVLQVVHLLYTTGIGRHRYTTQARLYFF